jgi:DNA (cytosine-5)-methyltransferase 1
VRLLDLFCGAGGCARGYAQAGFTEILGVDLAPQPRYPYHFVQDDAVDFLNHVDLNEFDLVHASPPCQLFTFGNAGRATNHLDLITPIREALEARAVEYVIENVIGAPLRDPIMLDGIMFGLKVMRKRLFETNWPLEQPPRRRTKLRADKHELSTVAGHGGNGCRNLFTWSLAMGISWMTIEEITQAIPPAYTRYIGKEFLSYKS